MKQLKVKLLLIFLSIPFIIGAQVLPSLDFNPDPQSFGMGMSGVSLTTDKPLGFYYNPAKLGYSAQTNNISFQFYPKKVNWTGFDGYKYSNSGLTVGYNFNKLLNGLNLSGGLGYISSNMDYPWVGGSKPGGWNNGYDKYNAISIGVSIDYFLNLAIGLTYKNIDTRFPGEIFWGWSNTQLRINAIDWGLLLNIPISKLTINDFVYKPLGSIELKPILNLSLGYSRSNIGKEIFYVNRSQSGPLPLTARLGYTLSLGADLNYKNHSINFMNFDFSVEAEDLLVNYDNIGNFSYQGLGGDLKPWQNLIELKRTDNVTLRRGLKLSLFESVSFLFGSFNEGSTSSTTFLPFNEGAGYSNKTNGIIFSTNGLFKLLSWDSGNNPYTKFILEHIEIQYIKASWISKSDYYSPNNTARTDIHAVSVSFNKFTF